MFRFLVVAFLFASASAGSLPSDNAFFGDRSERIIGGQEAPITDAPYQIAMIYSRTGSGFSLVCGASIISPRVLITVASCLVDTLPTEWRARAGSNTPTSGGQVVSIDRHIVHERFGSIRFDYDIGMQITAAPLDFDDFTVGPIFLPTFNQSIDDGTVGLITGWGATSEGGSLSATLRKASIPTVNQGLCETAYGGTLISSRMICLGNYVTGGLDACTGDQGGPFFVNGQLIALASWGNGCGRPQYPGVWSRVSAYREWIDTHIPANLTLDEYYY